MSRCGALQVVERMAASASGPGTARLYAYSGHDTTIMPILATLGVKLDDWPEYVANVVSWRRPPHVPHQCCSPGRAVSRQVPYAARRSSI